MDAKVGDAIVVDGIRTGTQPRTGKVLEVITGGGAVHYRVRWNDGHEAVFFPGANAHVARPRKRS
jgi:hypothetical protein